MFQKTKICTGLVLAFGGGLAITSLPALAQDAAPQRIEITGSAIKRIDAETAVPVTIIKADDLKNEGVTSVEQIIARLSASQSQVGTSQSVGAGFGGAAFADLRGLGQNKTLVLLNGRRIADNAIDGSAPDLNMIPFAALDRVEVLRDGASSLYGTDAIGGVINFITKKDMVGGTISAEYSQPQHKGGKQSNVNLGYGFGDLDKQGFNVLAVFDFQKQDQLQASQRPFGSTGYIPSRGISKSSGNAFPANYSYVGTDEAFHSANPAAPGCVTNGDTFTLNGVTCRYDYTRKVDLIPASERASGLLRGTLRLNANNELNVEYFYSRDKVDTAIAAVPYAGMQVNPFKADGVTPNPFYPGNGATAAPTGVPIDPTQPIYVSFRDIPGGPRLGQTINTQQRLLATLDGTVAGWDYSAGVAYNENKITDKVTGGYTDDTIIANGLLNGDINPFGDQTAAGSTLIAGSEITGVLQNAKGQTWTVDAHASREIGDWVGAGRQAALALGAEFRREKYSDVANVPVALPIQASTGFDANTNSVGSRSVYAAYAELNVPFNKQFEVTGALRFDHYSDFGSTTNPKISFRYQPQDQLLFRGSYSTGFRAPSLFELNAPITYTNTANSWNDPVLCPGGTAVGGVDESLVCGTQFLLQNGGVKTLKPETSNSWTLGMVFEPMRGTSIGIDLWWVRLDHQINPVAEEVIFGDPLGRYASRFVRNPEGFISVNGTDCPGADCGFVQDLNQNLGGIHTNGADLNIASRWNLGSMGSVNFDLNGTYVVKYEYQQEEGGAFFQSAGVYSGPAPAFRWAHTASASWKYNAFTIGLVNRYKSGYFDQNDPNQVAAGFTNNHVGNYSLWDIYGSWNVMKGLNLTVGVRNLFDQDPPFSNQGATFQQGYDPRFTDPTGRAYYVRAGYTF